jgi:3-isopropylmalate dehydrogenase
MKADAVLFGAIGHQNTITTQQQGKTQQGLLLMRKKLGLFANVRPTLRSLFNR